MSLEDLQAMVKKRMGALRSDLQGIAARQGHEHAMVGPIYTRAIREQLQEGEDGPASDDIAWQPPLPEHLESFCEIIRQAREEGHGPEIEQLIYSELEHV
ncbi:MAG: hypothetical protein ACXVZ3_05445 [Gaiellaceae bacterium]